MSARPRFLALRRGLLLAFAAACGIAAPALSAQENDAAPIDFEKQVLPILESRCLSCHRAPEADVRGRAKKVKGGLRLDGAGWIAKGGETGRVVVAGAPEKSELFRRVSLTEDDADLMPPKDGPLTAEQIETLQSWIRGGASYGTWTGAPGPAEAGAPASASAPAREAAATAAARAAAWQRLAEGLAPLAPSALEKISNDRVRIEAALPGTALLRASFPAHRTEIGDKEVFALAPLAEHLAVLDLARSKIGAKSLDLVARMPRLWKLDLSDTPLTAKDLAALGPALREVRDLNLNGTRADDASLAWLASLPALEDLYLWRTAVTPEGLSKLRAAKPHLRVRHTLELPEPPPPDANPAGGRRRR